MNKTCRRLLLGLVLSLSVASLAETRWISDELRVPLRSGPSSAHTILHRGLPAGTEMEILERDTEERVVTLPKDLEQALRREGALARFNKLSYTRRREWVESVEGAKKPETRERRTKKAVDAVSGP